MSGTGFSTRAAHPTGSCDPQNPWPGLLQYEEADREFFQGRQAETDELLRLVMRTRLSVLFGLSGLGKSSLLQAGLFPRLRCEENVLPVYLRLDFKPGPPDLRTQVLHELLNQASAFGIEAPFWSASQPAGGSSLTLWEYFHRSEAVFWDKKNRPVTPLLIFDQFEEFFTLGRSSPAMEHAVESFLDELSDLAEGRAPRAVKARLELNPEESSQYSFTRHSYKIVIAIREDFLPELEGLRERFTDLALNRMRLQAVNGVAALAIVNQAPELVDGAAGEHIVRFVAAGKPGQKLAQMEVDPAILSVVCYELNNQRRERGESKITLELLEGSKEEALGKFCETAFRGLPPQARYFVEEKLLTPAGHRDSCAQENALQLPGITQGAIDTLVECRLIRREEQHGMARLELAHDRLAEPIRLSRDNRREAETLERERVAAREARAREQEAREREGKALADLRRVRRQRAVLVAASTAVMVLAIVAGWTTVRARQANQKLLAEVVWTDPAHGLTWTRKDNGYDFNRAAAVLYCRSLRYGGYSDWRLPRVSEILALASAEGRSKQRAVYQSGDIWSDSLPTEYDPSQIWLRSADGDWTSQPKEEGAGRAVCVHGAPAAAFVPVSLPANFSFVPIPAGEFEMGCSAGDQQCTEDEKPRHPVIIRKPFQMSRYLVTQAAWSAVMGSNPSRFQKGGADLPVEVSWFDVQVFLSMLNERHDGYHYRLPTEAEWEYAARAGTTGSRYGDLEKIAWYGKNSGSEMHPIGQKDPNAWGLYDMLGNVWKWVQDPYERGGYNTKPSKAAPQRPSSTEARIRRGGSWRDLPLSIRASRRIMDDPDNRGSGFYCVREVVR